MLASSSVYLPFNRECLGDAFVPAKGLTARPEPFGYWVMVQDQALLVRREGDRILLPRGDCPLTGGGEDALWLGTLHGEPCWVVSLPPGAPAPHGCDAETLVPMRGS